MNIESLRILAKSDKRVFAETISSFGMKVIGAKTSDPLDKQIQEESITAMASIITEDINDNADLTPAQVAIKKMAGEVGLIVILCKD